MKILRLVCLSLITFSLTFASSVSLNEIETEERSGVQYFSEREFSKIGDYNFYWSHFKRKRVISIKGHTFVFTLFSPYIKIDGELSNLIYPIEFNNNRVWIPYKSFKKRAGDLFVEDTSEKKQIAKGPPKKSSKDIEGKDIENKDIEKERSDSIAQKNEESSEEKGNKQAKRDNQKKSGEKYESRTIIIDPGHGGRDPGAAVENTEEKDIVLQVAKNLKNIIESRTPDWEVALTRSTDKFVPLKARAKFANNNDADIFVTLHCNHFDDKDIRGSQCFYLSPAKNDQARSTAALENSVLFLEKNPPVQDKEELKFILMDMLQNEYLKESSHLAVHINKKLNSTLEVKKVREVDCAGFYLLRDIYMPSVLVELGFLSNPKDRRLLVSDDFQKNIAEAIYKGTKVFFKKELH